VDPLEDPVARLQRAGQQLQGVGQLTEEPRLACGHALLEHEARQDPADHCADQAEDQLAEQPPPDEDARDDGQHAQGRELRRPERP
ncbi:hypothetical protein DF186_19020, partial [Enterococcus hirae]